MTPNEPVLCWPVLADAVKARRVRLRLPIDLSAHAGPSEMTVRKVESGEPVSIRPRTKVALERALRWPDGHVDRLLAGHALPLDDVPEPAPFRNHTDQPIQVQLNDDDARALRIGRLVLDLFRELGGPAA